MPGGADQSEKGSAWTGFRSGLGLPDVKQQPSVVLLLFYFLYGTGVIGTLQMDIIPRRTVANGDISNCDGSPYAYHGRFQWNPGSNTTPTMTTRCPDVTLVALLDGMPL